VVSTKLGFYCGLLVTLCYLFDLDQVTRSCMPLNRPHVRLFNHLSAPVRNHRRSTVGGSRNLIDAAETYIVNTPSAKAGGFGLRLKAGSIGQSAD
jgi:hypothetical protein